MLLKSLVGIAHLSLVAVYNKTACLFLCVGKRRSYPQGGKMNPSGKVMSENHRACFRAGKLLLCQRVQSVECIAGAAGAKLWSKQGPEI